MSNGTTTRTKSYQYGTNGLLSLCAVPSGMTYRYMYDAYGNITSKTGMGSYTYGSTDHPHAVTAVEGSKAKKIRDSQGNVVASLGMDLGQQGLSLSLTF